ncbi:hypothetical protein NM688_g3777 [Phlebia brevispora]|uniref:Uncharacterized protein n=1 Tax=Phlebia brevispora TaxID=194682 RepID=A0ACC1T564_9APHY|nr:hypothetical protein NM688_g3777 [Phlebia brevispora]
MTNVPSGSKRPWDGSTDTDSHKRPREDSRDWRDVHLKSPGGKPTSERRDSIDRRRGEYRPRSRDRDGRRDRGRDRRDDRSRERRHDRDRDREREREYYDRRDEYRRDEGRREEHRRRSPSGPSVPPTPLTNGHTNGRAATPKAESEKEEGEISPRQSPRTQAAQPTSTAPPPTPSQSEPEAELELTTSPPSVEETLAARRARRQAILAKYAHTQSINTSQTATPSPGPSSAIEPTPISSVSDAQSQPHSVPPTPAVVLHALASQRESASASPTPSGFALAKEGDEEDAHHQMQEQDGNREQVSAADYDPSLDRREDEQKRVRGVNNEHDDDVEMIVEEEEEEDDDEIEDMFAIVSTEKKKRKVKKVKRVAKPAVPALITTTLDSAADAEGYYQVILGEQLDGGRYQVFSSLGKGMFANVVKARVLDGEVGEAGKEVAIKIVRCQESMYRAGLKEVQILNKLKQADPEDKKHIVRLERTFEHRGHLCLVFESMSMNLRDVVKRFGKDVGLNIRAVRAYAHQLFLALSLLRKCNIMHADIKPDNILVNEAKNLLKLCDLGSASDASENEITPYLVSRFYRAPEIILGVPYDPALDIWSIGCTLYELYTGKILFPGRSNNQMLLLMMELKGRFNTKMIKKAKFGDLYFDDLGAFQSVEKDRVTGADVVRKVHITKPSRDLRARLMPPASAKIKDDEMRMLTSFTDLLDKCLALDPAKRITPKEALVHACEFPSRLPLFFHHCAMASTKKLPTFDELPGVYDFKGCAWGVWGDDDQLGTVNLLTEEVVAEAAKEIKLGKMICLNWPLNFPSKPMFSRQAPTVNSWAKAANVNDDMISINTQSGSQWDGLKHFGLAKHNVFYNNTPASAFWRGAASVQIENVDSQNLDKDSPMFKLGIHNWAQHGICGRGVLLDMVQFYTDNGTKPLPYDPWATHPIPVRDLEACAKKEGITFRQGDILVLRIGWLEKWYAASWDVRNALANKQETGAGLEQGDEMIRFLWNNHFAAALSDQPTLERWPDPAGSPRLHQQLLGLWGMPIGNQYTIYPMAPPAHMSAGEFFDLEKLSKECAAAGRYTFFFTSWPLNVLGGVASPPNAAAYL